jgi:hypothetical protein
MYREEAERLLFVTTKEFIRLRSIRE